MMSKVLFGHNFDKDVEQINYRHQNGQNFLVSIKFYYEHIARDMAKAGFNPLYLLFDIFIKLPFGG